MKTRHPAVAGSFYPSSPQKLREVIEHCLEKECHNIASPPKDGIILGGVVPHAGYIYSGYHAVHFFETVRRSEQHFDTAVIIHPNHTGFGPVIALDDNEEWETPLGKIPIDLELSDLLPFERSGQAHKQEHSGEVMVPFLQYFLPGGLKILPIVMSRQTLENARMIAREIFQMASRLKRSILFIASSDFSHFLPPQKGHDLDEFVIREILAFNAEGVANQVRRFNISVCGFGPIMALIEYSRLKSNSPVAKVLRRGNSGETQPSQSVVDYVTLLFWM
jgi:AmmeMemoRadiSam system protein B